MLDIFAEVCTSMTRNKLRVSLTGFSVAFGIFMLIVLLSAGNGMLNGMTSMFGSVTNQMMFFGGWTSKPWLGKTKSRYITVDTGHIDALQRFFGGVIEDYVPTVSSTETVTYDRIGRSIDVIGTTQRYLHTEQKKIVAGRWLNEIDSLHRRKVLVLDESLVGVFFGARQPWQVIGEWVRVGDAMFRLVGVYRSTGRFGNEQQAFVPFTALLAVKNKSPKAISSVSLILHGLETAEQNKRFKERFNRAMAAIEGYDPSESPLWIYNMAEHYLESMQRMNTMKVFVWVIGVASLLAGVVGISNIMLITVRERTREFGIRKAIGATPRSIVALVLLEAVAIALVFGYAGMFLGILLVETVAKGIGSDPSGAFSVFENPSVDMGVVIGANAIMLVAGLVAGYVPALRAARIKPVAALAAS